MGDMADYYGIESVGYEWKKEAMNTEQEIIEAESVETPPNKLVRLDSNSVVRSGSVNDVLATMNDLKLIRTFIAAEMVEKVDFGVIPGTGDKKNLLLPGAQKINMFFNVYPEYDVQANEIGSGHVEYVVKSTLISRQTGQRVASGVGSCATMESKYRYRSGDGESTGQPVPRGYWDAKKEDPKRAQSLLGGPGFNAKKIDGQWMICKRGEKVENPDIYDTRNTVLKMAKKRSLVDAAIGLGCLSELFTQDMEDMDTFDVTESGAGESTTPASQPQHSSRAKASPQSPSPASDVESDEPLRALITLVEEGKNWKHAGVDAAMFKDSDNKKWKFTGEYISVARAAIKNNATLAVEYVLEPFEMNGKTLKNRLVTSAQKAMGGDAEG